MHGTSECSGWRRGIWLCLAGVTFTSMIAPFARYAIHHRQVDPLVFVAIWLTGAGLSAGCLGGLTDRPSVYRTVHHWRYLLLIGTVHLGSAITAFVGIKYVSAPTFAFLQSLAGPTAFLLGILFLNERAGRCRLLGVATAMLGTAAFLNPFDALNANALGVGLVMVSMVLIATMDLLVKCRPAAVATWSIVGARAGLPGLLLMLLVLSTDSAAMPDARLTWIILAGSFLGPFLGWFWFISGLRYLPLTVAPLIRSLAPALSAVYAAIFIDEHIGIWQVPGAALIVIGVALVSLNPNRSNRPVSSIADSDSQ